MAINITKINKTSAETKSAIARKSAQSLPNNPSERGYSAEEIKRRFYQPILDAANSAIAEIDRVVDEANNVLEKVGIDFNDFIESTEINDAYRVVFSNENWIFNESSNMFEILITKEEHGITDYTKIGVDMFLLDGNGNYIQVNQFEVQLDGTVRCFHESNGAGHVSVYEKREGFVLGSAIVEVDKIEGLAKVAKTNDYNDLDNIPDTNLAKTNEVKIAEMLSGIRKVGKSQYADNATNAVYAQTCASATNANNSISSNSATQATQDGDGNVISSTYAKTNGSYDEMKVGYAKMDIQGNNIVDTYATKEGDYQNMSVGKSTQATYAEYASNDKSKGTIEDRFKNLGFKEGSFRVIGGLATTQNINKIKRQGNYIIVNLDISYVNGYSTSDNVAMFGYIDSVGEVKDLETKGTALVTFTRGGNTFIDFATECYFAGSSYTLWVSLPGSGNAVVNNVKIKNFGFEAKPLT